MGESLFGFGGAPSTSRSEVRRPSGLLQAQAFAPTRERGETLDELRTLMAGAVARQARRESVDEDLAGAAGYLHSDRRLSRTEALHRGTFTLSGVLPGAIEETPFGPLHRVHNILEPHYCHGDEPIKGALTVDPALLAKLALDDGLSEVDPEGVLFFDTETTGLAGGTGTIPFLVGLAWFEDESLHVEQLFLRRLGEEVPILQYLAERLRKASLLVTYNGKSYDWPLIRTRFMLNRVPMPSPPPHLDLLHCARRVFKSRMGSVRLTEMEAQWLGYHREFDVDGALIPGLYLDFVRASDPKGAEGAALAPVIEHNGNDLAALAALLGKMGRHFEAPVLSDDPRDTFGYARVAERAKDQERAAKFAEAAADGADEDALAVQARLLQARTARRRKQVEAELEALRQALALAADEWQTAEVSLALSKCHEHRTKRFDEALRYARDTAHAEGEEAQEKRIARLERKIATTGEA